MHAIYMCLKLCLYHHSTFDKVKICPRALRQSCALQKQILTNNHITLNAVMRTVLHYGNYSHNLLRYVLVSLVLGLLLRL